MSCQDRIKKSITPSLIYRTHWRRKNKSLKEWKEESRINKICWQRHRIHLNKQEKERRKYKQQREVQRLSWCRLKKTLRPRSSRSPDTKTSLLLFCKKWTKAGKTMTLRKEDWRPKSKINDIRWLDWIKKYHWNCLNRAPLTKKSDILERCDKKHINHLKS